MFTAQEEGRLHRMSSAKAPPGSIFSPARKVAWWHRDSPELLSFFAITLFGARKVSLCNQESVSLNGISVRRPPEDQPTIQPT